MERLLELRKRIKAKKPRFVRTDIHKKKKLAVKWRKPKGKQNKMRLKKRGYRRIVKIGYGSPAAVKNVLKTGLKAILVKSLKDIKNLDPKKEEIILSKNIGLKKKVEIIKKSGEIGLNIANIKDTGLFMKDVEEKLNAKKTSREKVSEEKEKRKKEREEKAREKEAKEKKDEGKNTEDDLAKKLEDEEKKKKEDEQKVLTKKE